jgi:gamma-glutamylcyclotransferase
MVFKLTLSDSERLDSLQDVRLDGTGAYFHYPTVVMDAEGNEYPVLLYKRFLSGEACSPSAEYMDTVIAGALFHGLPSAYLEKLRSIATRKASFPVPVIFEHERSVTFGTNACDCGGLKKSGSE